MPAALRYTSSLLGLDSLGNRIIFFVFCLMLILAGALAWVVKVNVERDMRQQQLGAARDTLDLLVSELAHDYDDLVRFKLNVIEKRSGLVREVNTANAAAMRHSAGLQHPQGAGVPPPASPVPPLQQRRALALDFLRSYAPAKSMQFFVFDAQYKGVYHSEAAQQGRDWSGYRDLQARRALPSVVAMLKDTAEVFTVISWPGEAGQNIDRFAHIIAMPALGWYLGTSVDIQDLEKEVAAKREEILTNLEKNFTNITRGSEATYFLFDSTNISLIAPPQHWTRDPEGDPVQQGALFQTLRQAALQKTPVTFGAAGNGAGNERIAFVAYFKALDWYIANSIPMEDIVSPGRRLTTHLVSLMLLFFLAASFCILVMVRRFMRPVVRLTDYAGHLAASDFRSSPGMRSDLARLADKHHDEIGRLATAFSSMFQDLGRYVEDLQHSKEELQTLNARLEGLVDERTRFLQQEVAQRRRKEEELQQSEARYRRLFEDAILGIFLCTPEGNLAQVNRAFASMFGFQTPEECLQGGIALRTMLRVPEELDELETLVRQGQSVSRETRFCRADGSSFPGVLHAWTVQDQQGDFQHMEGFVEDSTERKHLEQEAIRASQLASVGELAAGVAHEVNNPINGIINYAELLLDDPEALQSFPEIPQRIIMEGERIAAIVSSLLFLSRKMDEEPDVVALPSLLEQALNLTGKQLEHAGISLHLDIPDSLPPLFIREQKILQVLLNLLSNARHALELQHPGKSPRKRIEITARPLPASGARLVRTTITDYGLGIPEDALRRIFEPFYTTKEKNQGTGLGLSICDKIVREHGGRLQFESEMGVYTSALLDLPAWDGQRA